MSTATIDEQIIVATKSLVVANDDGFALTFDDDHNRRALIVLDMDEAQTLLMRLLRRAYATAPEAAALGRVGAMGDLATTPCSQIGLAGTAEGETLLAIGIGRLAIPALVGRPELQKLADDLNRFLAATA